MQTSIFSSPKWLAVLLTIYGLEYLAALFLSAPPEQNTEVDAETRRLTLIPSESEESRLSPARSDITAPEISFPPWLRPQELSASRFSWATPPAPPPSLEPGRRFLPENASIDGFSDLLSQRPNLPDLEEAPELVFRERPSIRLRGGLKGWRLVSEPSAFDSLDLPLATAPTTAEIILNGPGQPLSVTQIESCGVPELDQYAINTLQKSEFTLEESSRGSPSNEWVIGQVDIQWSAQR